MYRQQLMLRVNCTKELIASLAQLNKQRKIIITQRYYKFIPVSHSTGICKNIKIVQTYKRNITLKTTENKKDMFILSLHKIRYIIFQSCK